MNVDKQINYCPYIQLTNMSTIPILVQHESDGTRLRRYRPLFRGNEREVRKLTMTVDLIEWSQEPVEAELLREGRAQVRAHFKQFVTGQPVDDLHFMKRVEDTRLFNPFSHGVWSFCPRFDPQYRFFGLFAISDWFVAFLKESREDLHHHPEKWRAAIDGCLTNWTELFPGREPWIRDTLPEFVSNAEKLDDRW